MRTMEPLKAIIIWFLAALGAFTILVVAISALAVYNYARLVITFKSISAVPDFKATRTSILGSIWSVIKGNLASASGGFENGVRMDGEIICRNRSLLPIYLPDIEHEVTISEKVCENMVHTKATWLKPRSDEAIPINFTLAAGEIPHVAISSLTGLGAIDVRIRSRVVFGPFAYIKITETKTEVPDYFPKKASKDKKKASK